MTEIVNATLEEFNGQQRVFLKTPYALKDVVKALPNARWHPQSRRWHIPASPAAVATMKVRFSGSIVGMDAEVATLLARAVRMEEAQSTRTAEALPEIPGRYCECEVPTKADDRDLKCSTCGAAFKSHLHQRQAFWFVVNGGMDAAMLAMDMGTGKSKVTVSLAEQWQPQRVIIVCPKNVVGVWPREFRFHAAGDWKVITPPDKGTVQKKAWHLAQQCQLAQARGQKHVVVLNYDICWRPGLSQFLLSQDWDLGVLDESHRAKSPGGKTSKFLARLGPKCRRRLTLTGTPMPHSPLDIYGQYRFLEPGIFGTSFARHRARYAVMGGFEDRQVVDYVNQAELNEKWGSIAYVCKSEDVLDLPGYMVLRRLFELSPKSRRAYDTIKSGLILEVNGGLVTPANALTKMLRMQQITSGYVRDDEKCDHVVDDDKAKALKDELDGIPTEEPVVIFFRFTHDAEVIRAVCDAQGRRVGELSGRSRDALTADATMREDIDVAIVQLKSGGVGIDLTRSRTAIYYSMDTSLGDFLQSMKRLDRPGQRRSVRFIFLLAEDSLDLDLVEALESRQELVEAFIAAARKESTALREAA